MPTYQYFCDDCDKEYDHVRQMAMRDMPSVCPDCGRETYDRVFYAPAVMNTALPDGTRRFDDIRRYRAIERAKKAERNDTAAVARLENERKKLMKESA